MNSDTWLNRPLLPLRLRVVMVAMGDLASSRTEQGIAFDAVLRYAETLKIEPWWLWDRLRPIDYLVMNQEEKK